MLDNFGSNLQKALGKLKGKKKLTEDNIADGMREIRRALLEADVNIKVTKEFVKKVKEKSLGEKVIDSVDPSQQIVKIVQDELTELLGGTDSVELNIQESGTTVILMAGLQGAGKTTTCGKLAMMLKKQNKKIMLVAADLKRPAAVEQLRVLAGQVGVDFFIEEGKTPPEVCKAGVKKAKAEEYDIVILDTAGRLHVDEELMDEVSAVAKYTSPHEILLVVDSMTGQDAVNSAATFNERLELSGLILTKLDGDTRGGAALSLRTVTGKPIKFVGMGEKLDRLEVLHAERMAGRILGMGDVVTLVEKASELIDEDEAMGLMQKMMSGKFGLDDLISQMNKIKKMGPLKHVMKMMPGMGDMMEGMDMEDSEAEMKRTEAIVQSMTAKEKASPDMINTSRRRRIAQGCGRSTKDIQALLKQFNGMRKMMKNFAPMMGGAAPGAEGGEVPKGLSSKEIREMRKKLMKGKRS